MLKNQKQLKTDKVNAAQNNDQAEVVINETGKEEKTVVVTINRVTKVVKGGKRSLLPLLSSLAMEMEQWVSDSANQMRFSLPFRKVHQKRKSP